MRTAQIPPPIKRARGPRVEARAPDAPARRLTPREMGCVRTTLDVPELQHKRLRLAAIEQGTTIRDLILALLEKEGIKNR